MGSRIHSFILAAGLVLGLAACSGDSSEEPPDEAPQTPSTVPTDGDASLPVAFFSETAPEGAVPLIDVKGAKAGDSVVFEARVGGRRDSFIENRAMFFVADPSILSCDQLHGDTCKTPWDYCCEPRDNLAKHMATIQVVDAKGEALKFSIQNTHGLDHLKTIVVSGVVKEASDGVFVVNADSIHVKG